MAFQVPQQGAVGALRPGSSEVCGLPQGVLFCLTPLCPRPGVLLPWLSVVRPRPGSTRRRALRTTCLFSVTCLHFCMSFLCFSINGSLFEGPRGSRLALPCALPCPWLSAC